MTNMMKRILIFAAVIAAMASNLSAVSNENLYFPEKEAFVQQFDKHVKQLQNNFAFWGVPDQTILWKFKNYGALKFVDGKIILGDERRVDQIDSNGQNLLINQNYQTKLAIQPLLDSIAKQVAKDYTQIPNP